MRELLASYPATASLASAALTPVPGGLSNFGWRAVAGGRSHFVRLTRPATEGLGADHRNEARVLAVACAAGLAPRMVHCDAEVRLLVTEWVDAVAAPRPRAHAIDAVGRTLARLHGLTVPADLRVMDFGRQALELESALPAAESYRRLRTVAQTVFDALHCETTALVLCHHDLNPLNLLFERGGQLWLVDWEYAGLGDPVFDLASYASQHGLGSPARVRLAAAYTAAGGRPIDAARLDLATWAFDYVQWLWYRAASDTLDTLPDRELAGARTARLASSLRGRASRLLRCNNASFADNETRV